jgi:hypothetical protein
VKATSASSKSDGERGGCRTGGLRTTASRPGSDGSCRFR